LITQFDPLNETRIASALGVKLGYTDNKNYSNSFIFGGAQNAMNNEIYPILFGSTPISDLASTMARNFGLTGDLLNIAKNYIQNQLLPLTFQTRGSKIVDIINLFCDLTNDPSFGSYATNFNLHVNNAVSYAQIKYLPNVNFDINSALTLPPPPVFKLIPSAPTGVTGTTLSFQVQTTNFPIGSFVEYSFSDFNSLSLINVKATPVDSTGIEVISFTVSPYATPLPKTVTLTVGDSSASMIISAPPTLKLIGLPVSESIA